MHVLVPVAVRYVDRRATREKFNWSAARNFPRCHSEIKTQVLNVTLVLLDLQERLVQLRVQAVEFVEVVLAAEELADEKRGEGDIDLEGGGCGCWWQTWPRVWQQGNAGVEKGGDETQIGNSEKVMNNGRPESLHTQLCLKLNQQTRTIRCRWGPWRSFRGWDTAAPQDSSKKAQGLNQKHAPPTMTKTL